MKKEKYIEEKYSESKAGSKKKLIAYVVNMPLPNGKKYYVRFKLEDYVSQSAAYKAAIKARDEEVMLIRRAEEGLYSFSDYTVQDLFDMIPENFDRRLKTYISYEKMYNKYIRNLYGSHNIKTIKEGDILKTLQNCASQCGANYVSKLKSVWKKIYIVGQRKRVVQSDLSHLVDNPRSEIVTERSMNEQNITEEEFELFCQAMSEYGHYLPSEKEKIYNRNIMLYMLKLMRIIGIRSQEARALRRENFNLVETEIMDGNGNAKRTRLAYVCIRKSIGSSRTELVAEVSTKTPQSVRDIPVTGDGVKLIEEILAYSKHDLIFADYNGNPFSTEDFSDYLYRVSRSCGIKVYSLLMRKAFSADLYREKENPASIKKLMGHKKEDMSLNAYASASREELINATMNRKFKK